MNAIPPVQPAQQQQPNLRPSGGPTPAQQYQQSAQQAAQQAQPGQQQQGIYAATAPAGSALPNWFTGQSPIAKMANIFSDSWNSYKDTAGNALVPDSWFEDPSLGAPDPRLKMDFPLRDAPEGPQKVYDPAQVNKDVNQFFYDESLANLRRKFPGVTYAEKPAPPKPEYPSRQEGYGMLGSGTKPGLTPTDIDESGPARANKDFLQNADPAMMSRVLPLALATGLGGAAGGMAGGMRGAIGGGAGAAGGGYLGGMLLDYIKQNPENAGRVGELIKSNPQLAPALMAATALAGGLGGYGLSRLFSGDKEREPMPTQMQMPMQMPMMRMPTLSQQLSF